MLTLARVPERILQSMNQVLNDSSIYDRPLLNNGSIYEPRIDGSYAYDWMSSAASRLAATEPITTAYFFEILGSMKLLLPDTMARRIQTHFSSNCTVLISAIGSYWPGGSPAEIIIVESYGSPGAWAANKRSFRRSKY